MEASLFSWLGTLLILAKFGMASDTAIKAGPKELRKEQISKRLRNQKENKYMRNAQEVRVDIRMNAEDGSTVALSGRPVEVVIK